MNKSNNSVRCWKVMQTHNMCCFISCLIKEEPKRLVVKSHLGEILVADALPKHGAAVQGDVRVPIGADHVLHHKRLALHVGHESFNVLAHQIAEDLFSGR